MVYESGSLARAEAIAALAAKRRAYRVVYHSSSLQPLHNLPKEFELPTLGSMDVAVLRSKDSQRSRAVDAMYDQFVNTLGK